MISNCVLCMWLVLRMWMRMIFLVGVCRRSGIAILQRILLPPSLNYPSACISQLSYPPTPTWHLQQYKTNISISKKSIHHLRPLHQMYNCPSHRCSVDCIMDHLVICGWKGSGECENLFVCVSELAFGRGTSIAFEWIASCVEVSERDEEMEGRWK